MSGRRLKELDGMKAEKKFCLPTTPDIDMDFVGKSGTLRHLSP